MQTVTTIGFDIAKSVFQVHGVDAVGQVVIRRQLKRRHVLAFFEKLPPCPLCQDPWHRASALAHGIARPTPYQGRRHRAFYARACLFDQDQTGRK